MDGEADLEGYIVYFADGSCEGMSILLSIRCLGKNSGDNQWKQFIVGIWVPLWGLMRRKAPEEKKALQEAQSEPAPPSIPNGNGKPSGTWQAALLLGSAMVARGEIGLLIIEIGYNDSGYVSKEGFITGVWAILLNTIIGPVIVGILVKWYGRQIGEGVWGVQPTDAGTGRPSQETRAESDV